MITIKKFVFNGFLVNTYILFDETREAIIVDAACADTREERQLVDFLEANSLKLVRNINTHCHIDHILGNAFIEDHYGLRPEYHPASESFLLRAKEIGDAYGFRIDRIPEAGSFINDGEKITWGQSELNVLYTPGHADGSCCLYSQKQGFVLSGDVLFRDSIGRTDFPTGDFDLLMESIRERLFTLPDNTIVYSGHGPETEIGYEKRNNPFIR
ncbi:MAG: MBL fold metallo-hydrolase [Bacteroidetes bacterium]|nr:MAG: MBL fold metallo-hydrolase [Bacteroidota bacterium]